MIPDVLCHTIVSNARSARVWVFVLKIRKPDLEILNGLQMVNDIIHQVKSDY